MFILFHYLPKNFINDYQLKINSTYQYIAKFRSKCAKTKKTLCPELTETYMWGPDDYRLGTVNSNTVNSNFALNSKFYFKSTYDLIKDQRI